jgi:hypothetical protein
MNLIMLTWVLGGFWNIDSLYLSSEVESTLCILHGTCPTVCHLHKLPYPAELNVETGSSVGPFVSKLAKYKAVDLTEVWVVKIPRISM